MPASEETAEAGGETTGDEAASDEPLLVPDNIDFELNTNIQKTRYNGIDIKNVRGNVRLKDEIATLKNLSMDAMGGNIGLTGNYNTQNHSQPKMDFGYTLRDVDINSLSRHFLTVEKLAPITKYAYGKISSNFKMTTDLTPSLEPIMSSISSVGDLSSNSLSIKGFELLEKLESVTKLKNISNQTLKAFKTNFTVKDGKVSVTPFKVNLGKISTDVSGYTTLDQQMDYKLKMNVPKNQLPASVIKQVEGLLGQANAAIPFVEIGKLPDIIPVNVKMFGDVKNPKITTDMKEAIMNAMGVEGNIIDNITETIKDTITEVINDVIDDGKEELEKQKQKILADAQKQADKVIAEGKKQGDRLRAEAKKQGDDLIKAAGSNPLKKVAAKKSAEQLNKTADNQAKKVEAEANKQADNIMAKARAEADKIGK